MRIEDYPSQEPPSSSEAVDFFHRVTKRAEGVRAEEIPYGPDPYQAIAICAPRNPNGTVLVFAHGGGWVTGYKENLLFMGPVLNAAGITFATVGYRLALKYLFPAGFDDMAAAIALLYRRASNYGGDPKRIFIGGHSAGGHYAALLALRRDWQSRLELPENVIRGCLPLCGVYDVAGSSGLPTRPRFLGAASDDDAASPLRNIQGKPSPFLIAHGGVDFPHLMRQAELMERELRKAGGEVERIVLEGENHFSSCYAIGEPNDTWAPRAVAWMAEH
jgi:arylformamidase